MLGWNVGVGCEAAGFGRDLGIDLVHSFVAIVEDVVLVIEFGEPLSQGQFMSVALVNWRPPRRYDTLPPSRLPGFWDTVAGALAPNGKAIFIDDGPAEAAREEVLAQQPIPAVLRRLDDGQPYRVVKVFHDVGELSGKLATLGWSADVRTVGGSFIMGTAEPPTTAG
ncbi:hypothetical protein [Streptomyces swartbergensis]|uniref:hypothetical protein n=1 Tax=Streptomyces swartbergensis TaxID=487165 RepID=UPI0037F2E346